MTSSWHLLTCSRDLSCRLVARSYERLSVAARYGPRRSQVYRARVAALAAEPRPEGSSGLGETNFRRLRLDQYRVLYEVTPDTVRVMHVGRVLQR